MTDNKHLLVTTLAGAAVGLTGGCVICISNIRWSELPEYWQPDQTSLRIPVDAAPWLLRPCGHATPTDCALIIDGARVPVDVEDVGADACNLAYDEALPQAAPFVLQTLRPRQPLPPGATARLDCDDPSPYTQQYYEPPSYYYGYGQTDEPLTLQIQQVAAPAAPPGDLADLAIHYTRDDPNQCGARGDYLTVSLDFDAAYLREGGYVEVTYPNGQVLTMSRPQDDGHAWLPGSHGPLTLVPVSITGERGEPVIVDEHDMTDDAVYIPGCSVDPNSGPSGLLVLGWLIAARRRRRSA